MKKLLLICTVILAMFSCKKDEAAATLAQKDIVGKWNVTQMWNETQNKWTDVPEGRMWVKFNADNTYMSVDATTGWDTYTLEGNTVVCTGGTLIVKYEFKLLSANNAEATVTVGSAKPYKVKATRL